MFITDKAIDEGVMVIKEYQTSDGIPFEMALFTKKGMEILSKNIEADDRRIAAIRAKTFKSTLCSDAIMKYLVKKSGYKANVPLDGRVEMVAKAIKMPIAQVKKEMDRLYEYGFITPKAGE